MHDAVLNSDLLELNRKNNLHALNHLGICLDSKTTDSVSLPIVLIVVVEIFLSDQFQQEQLLEARAM